MYCDYYLYCYLQVCATTDNGSNIVCALNQHLKWPILPCFGHNLHLAVTNAVKNDARVMRALGVCRKLITTFSHSWKKCDLTECQETLNLPVHSLKIDCATRWGSTQMMIDCILEQKDAIKQILRADSRTRHLCPTWQDMDVLESLQAGMGPLNDY